MLEKSHDIKGVGNTDKRAFAAHWWRDWLMVMDYMPKCAPPTHPSPTPAHVYGLLHAPCTCSLSVCLWLPLRSENKIVIRGPSYKHLHQTLYGNVAKNVGMFLSYKSWMDCQSEGLCQVAEALPGCDVKTLKCARCARHSKFPECSTCSRLRKAWLLATQNVGTAPQAVHDAWKELRDHVKEWSEDRRIALQLRMSCFQPEAGAMYECDDK
jgi:hypothetical protein